MNAARATRGEQAVRLHPDFGQLDFETAASDMIADVLHAVAAYYRANAGGDPDPLVRQVWIAGSDTYYGDGEDES
jgi:hypothetical protein